LTAASWSGGGGIAVNFETRCGKSKTRWACSSWRTQGDVDLELIPDYQNNLSIRRDTLCALDDDLNNSDLIVELWGERNDIEELVMAL